MARAREDAQQRRADARRKRRQGAPRVDGEERADVSPRDESDALDSAKQTAKLAAAGAALGAAVGAATALAGRDGRDDDQDGRPRDAQAESRIPEEDDEHEDAESEAVDEEQPQPVGQGHPDDEGEDDPDSTAGGHRDEMRADGGDAWPDVAEPGSGTAGSHEHESVSTGRARRLVESAREQLRELRGMDAETVSSLRHVGDGWAVTLEVVEVHRIPESTDVLASYEVVVDEDGDLVRYERGGRYYRGRADEGGAR